jgi:hypothetical protein
MANKRGRPRKQSSEMKTNSVQQLVKEISGNGISVREVSIPLDESAPTADFGLHVELRLTAMESNGLRKLSGALDKSQIRLASGRRVTTPHQAVRWLIERVAGMPEHENGKAEF